MNELEFIGAWIHDSWNESRLVVAVDLPIIIDPSQLWPEFGAFYKVLIWEFYLYYSGLLIVLLNFRISFLLDALSTAPENVWGKFFNPLGVG